MTTDMESLLIKDYAGEYLTVAYTYHNNRVWFISYFDHKIDSEPTTIYLHRLSEVA